MIQLTEGQSQLIDKVKVWFKNWENGFHIGDHPQWFAYSGGAGTGKTTVAKEILRELGLSDEEYISCAYVGKAVMQLQRNGLTAKTIHSLIYDVVTVKKPDPKTGEMRYVTEFVLKFRLNPRYRLIIVDEAPMVNDELAGEIMSFGLPVIFMGDMNQLPPVFGVSSIMTTPDHILTQIMRQKEDDPIVQLANMVLHDIPLLEGDYGRSKVVREFELDNRLLSDYDQIICNTNKMRAEINDFVRGDLLGRRLNRPYIRDKVVCRQNNWAITVNDFALTNGLAGVITDIQTHELHHGYYIIDFRPDFFTGPDEFLGIQMDAKYIKASYDQQKKFNRLKHEKFEYAYAVTCYTAQGSEWPRVLFFDSFFHDEDLTKKSRYTAITRAREAITIVSRAQPSRYKYTSFNL